MKIRPAKFASHGGATWNGKVNRKQLLGKLVPVIIRLMLDHPEIDWGPACYPVVEVS